MLKKINDPKISIVIPSYNKARFIGKTLKSIVSQNYDNFEVVIQDGGSNDGSLKIIKSFAKKYSKKIKYSFGKDGGQLDAINSGLRKSTGEILTYINADDYYFPGAFREISTYFLKNPDALYFVGKGIIVNEDGSQIAKIVTWYKDMLLSLNRRIFLLSTNYFMQPSVFITKNAYKTFGPFIGTKKFVMEYDLWLKLSEHGMPVVLPLVLSGFRIEKNTKTKQMSSDLLMEDEKIIAKYTDNKFIIGLHKLNNIGRKIVNKFV